MAVELSPEEEFEVALRVFGRDDLRIYGLPVKDLTAIHGLISEWRRLGVQDRWLRDFEERERLRQGLRSIVAKVRWFADNDARDPQEVDHALCVEVLDLAERALNEDSRA